MRSTKLLFLTAEFPPQPGGIGNHAHHVAKKLSEHNFEVTVLADIRSKQGREEVNFDAVQAYKVFRIKRTNPIIFTYVKRLQTTLHLLRSHDIVLVSGKFPIWMGGLISLFSKKKIYAVIHGTEVSAPSGIKLKFTKWCLRQFETIIAVSNFTRSLIAKWNLKNIQVIPNGFAIGNAISEIRKINLKAPRLITVGNVTERKGQHNVIKALPQLQEKYPDIKYDIVGTPTEKNQILQLARSLNLTDAVVIHGIVSEAEKIRLLQNASIFMMLSEPTESGAVEGFGIAILEANALGVPAIGSNGCGIEDAIADGISGKLVHYDNVEAVCDAVTNLLELNEVYGKQAKEWSKNFTWDKVITRYIEILQK